MGRHQKHEEHTNHERWIVSFADMMTLLFALFVVLYALGKVDMAKLKRVQESIKFAFNVAGSGKTKDQGLFDKQSGAGDTQLPVPLINAQDGPMKEFLHETLTQFEQVAGKSLDIVQKDDTISLRAPLSTFFDASRAQPVKRDVFNWLVKAVQGSTTFASDIRIVIDAPDVPIGMVQGRPATSLDLCVRRLATLRKVMLGIPEVRPHMVRCEWAQQKETAGAGNALSGGDWESRGQVTIAFSNMKAENR